ncbi:tail fiber protein [Pantoea vagans]|uniref:tail fiber protein n=1 Tax=Pantoea vagans TaxID=470934 RepID=UPI0023AF27F9|nr:tail fiber protein [Pantoea vagans]MDE8556136.1 tail fiber protein [Pantoea vagans]MDE8576187.1 tail fiber protein [Pantoea vagans]
MAANNFKAFALDPNANVLSQAEWEALPALLSGFSAGKASSAQVNKAIRQATFIASAVAQFVSDALTQDVLDDGNSQAFVTALKQAITYGSVPAGIPVPWPAATPPAGWLKCSGSNFNTATYPLLAKAYPSGKLPDLRGEFIRGWDDGRGADAGRQILSLQLDALQRLTGTLESANGVGIMSRPHDSSGGVFSEGPVRAQAPLSSTDKTGYAVTFDSAAIARSDSETRPRNVAFNYIVRAI